MKISRVKYFILFVIVLMVEVMIALFVHDNFIRPYVGDILVILCMYFFAKFIVLDKIKNLSLYLLIFSIIIELIQYFQLFNNLTSNHRILKIILGATFDVKDILCYIIGYFMIILFEKHYKTKKS